MSTIYRSQVTCDGCGIVIVTLQDEKPKVSYWEAEGHFSIGQIGQIKAYCATCAPVKMKEDLTIYRLVRR